MVKNSEIIQTERLILREINETDAIEIVKWRSDPDVYKFFKSPHEITLEEHLKWYNDNYCLNKNRFDWICIEKKTGEKIGVFGLSFDNDVVEISYLLDRNAQHKGYAREIISCLSIYAFEKKEVYSIIAEIHKDNGASIRFIQGLGFTFLKCNGDFVIYCKKRS